jgi:hypothetical protein
MPATVGGEVVVPAVRWGWLSSTTVVASVWPPSHHDRPALEQKVVSRSDSLSRHEGWEEAATEWMSTMAMKLKTKNGGKNQNSATPTWCTKCRSGFMTLPPVLLQEQPAVILLLKMTLVSWSLAIDEHDEREDLHGSGHQNVIPYVHGRMELYCSSLALPV